ncbi:DUF3164 family protein [Neisseriaceae bacterium JH1-16]|nr:DUF3164 family protein [Neisseriaceae bacterium JH1-16]
MNPIPHGYKQDGRGRLIPLAAIKPIDLARDELVAELVARARHTSEQLAAFKQHAFDDIAAFVELSAERYGAHLGGQKGNVSLVSFDGRYKVQRAIQDTLCFDEGLQAAKALIDACLHAWSEGAPGELRALINDAFDVDREGRISTARILSLRRLDIRDARWLQAMAALNDSVRVQCSKSYRCVYQRDEASGDYRAIALDLATV